MQMVGAGVKRIAFGKAIEAERADRDGLQPIAAEHMAGHIIPKDHGIQNGSGGKNSAAGKAAAGGQVAIEQDINAENEDDGNQERTDHAHNQVGAVVDNLHIRPDLPAAAGLIHQDGDGAHGGEQNKGFAQRIKGAVIQNHTRHRVYCAGLLGALLHIAAGYLVDGGAVGVAVRRQAEGSGNHNQGHEQAQTGGGHIIEPPGTAEIALIDVPVFAGLVAVHCFRIRGAALLTQPLGQVYAAAQPDLQQIKIAVSCLFRHDQSPPPGDGRCAPRPCQSGQYAAESGKTECRRCQRLRQLR